MGNIVKFNETRLDNSIKSGGFNIGVNDTPTDLTGFYNGISPILSGYTIYIDKPSDGPSIYAPQNDSDLVDITNKLGGSVSTATEALIWINSQSNMTVVNGNYPPIVTDGLVLNLDAGFVSSYPKTGTTWRDLSGNGNNGTLVNGPTFSSNGGGSIVFDGSGKRITLPTPFGQTGFITVSVWYKRNDSVSSTSWRTIFATTSTNIHHLIFQQTSVILGIFDGGFRSFGYVPPNDSNFHNYTVIYQNAVNASLYVDGVFISTVNTSLNFSTSPIGSIGNWSGGNYWVGIISQTLIYNRALTQQEITQNYYAGLQRFISTDGLVLSLDAQNTNLYATSPTTAYDISGNNNNGSMLNGTQYVGDGDGSWSFDGIDDRVVTNFNTLDLSSTWNVWVNRTQSKNVYNMIMGMYLPYFGFRSNGDIHFSININGQKSLYAGVSLSDNVWYFMSFVSSYSDGNTTIMIYLNGVLQNQATYAGQQRTNPQSFMMGTWYSGGTYPFNGKIGQVQIYNRALTQTEITTIYNATRTRYGI